ncbi:MAG TPA: transporter [Thermoanaerobaculia bacterium]|nr:transporter [Thermoanaerobaculia bacterium]
MKTTVAVLLLTFAATARAQTEPINADRPGLADSSAVVGRGTFQLETGFERDDDEDSVPTLFRYGLTDAFELRVETDWDDAALGFKYKFRDEPSLGVIASIGRDSSNLRLAADYDLGERWSLNPNVGVQHEDDVTSAVAALTVQYNVSEKSNVFVDSALQASTIVVDAGAAWILGRDTQLDVSAGWRVHGDGAPDHFWSAGISRRF